MYLEYGWRHHRHWCYDSQHNNHNREIWLSKEIFARLATCVRPWRQWRGDVRASVYCRHRSAADVLYRHRYRLLSSQNETCASKETRKRTGEVAPSAVECRSATGSQRASASTPCWRHDAAPQRQEVAQDRTVSRERRAATAALFQDKPLHVSSCLGVTSGFELSGEEGEGRRLVCSCTVFGLIYYQSLQMYVVCLFYMYMNPKCQPRTGLSEVPAVVSSCLQWHRTAKILVFFPLLCCCHWCLQQLSCWPYAQSISKTK